MNNQSQQLLRDSNIKPTDKIIAEGLGEVSSIYTIFFEELKKNNISLTDWRYYNDGKAWLSKGEYRWTTSRGTSKIKPIFWVSIWKGFFKISFSFSESVKEKLLTLSLSEETKKMISLIKPNGNKMKSLSIVFDVYNDSLFNDIFILSEFRKENI